MKNEMPKKDLNTYLRLPYTVILRRDEDGDWLSRIEELEGCVAHGPTQAEALANLDEVKKAWIEDALEADDQIPEPLSEEGLPSGRWLQRVPRSRHKKLSDMAKREKISLNQLISTLLAEAVGTRSAIELCAEFYQRKKPTTSYALWAKKEFYDVKWEITQPRSDHPLYLTETLSTLVTGFPNIMVEESSKVTDRVSKKELAYQT